MERDLAFVTVCPDDNYYTWQVHLWLESLRELGKSDKAVVLIFIPNFREQNPKWDQVLSLYPEAQFVFVKDEDNASSLLPIYIPVLRPYTMWRFLRDNPTYCSKAIFYCDSDILFTKDFNIDKYLEDGIHYLSDTNSYINATYFDSKIKDVLPEKLEEYKTRDILAEVTSLIGISREICEKNNDHSGGAQYLLKNTDSNFWSKVMNDCILIRTYLQKVNREFFRDENAGFQSWCADMWAVLWNLWLRNYKTQVVPEMNFAWSTDPLDKLQETTILHNAGIVSETGNGYPAFYKGKYHLGEDPMADNQIDVVLKDETSKKYCTWYYAKKLSELNEKYKLIY
jgi:hypothetical protein